MACRMSLKNLGLDYVDLYLMHSPIGYEYREPEELLPRGLDGKTVMTDVDFLDTWKAMERLVDLGKVHFAEKSYKKNPLRSHEIARCQ